MEFKFSRRQFGQVAIASTATAAVGLVASKAFAQQRPNVTILGVNLGPKDTDAPSRPILLQSLNMATGQIQDLPSPNLSLRTGKQISGLTKLANGHPVLAVTPVASDDRGLNQVILVDLVTLQSIPLPGLNRQEKLGGIVPSPDGNLLALVLKKNGRPPVRLYDINLQTGEILDRSRVAIPTQSRVATLTKSPEGTLYAVLLGDLGQGTLVELDQQTRRVVDRVKLKVNGKPLNNGIQGLVYVSSNQIFAFGSRRYQQPNSVYLIDQTTGDLTLETPFNALQITAG